MSENKVNLIKSGHPTIIEKDIEELCAEGHKNGRLTATLDVHEAVHHSEISFIAVGTPQFQGRASKTLAIFTE